MVSKMFAVSRSRIAICSPPPAVFSELPSAAAKRSFLLRCVILSARAAQCFSVGMAWKAGVEIEWLVAIAGLMTRFHLLHTNQTASHPPAQVSAHIVVPYAQCSFPSGLAESSRSKIARITPCERLSEHVGTSVEKRHGARLSVSRVADLSTGSSRSWTTMRTLGRDLRDTALSRPQASHKHLTVGVRSHGCAVSIDTVAMG